MRTDAGLVTLICERWEEARRRGADPSPEELCRDHPELLDEVRRAVRNLAAADRRLADATADPDVPADALPAGCRYRLVRFLAAGGLGRVYVGFDTELNREVAVKFVLPHRLSEADAVRRFEWEAEVTGRLEHPGIAPVYGLVRDPATRTVAYAMRLLPGETLQDAGTRWHAGPATPADPRFRELLAHLVRACRTVGFAHARGFLHRDLKPSNVMAGPGADTWVLDWGLAKALTAAAPDPTPTGPQTDTAAGMILGTPAYMAPEQAAGQADRVGPAADVYALGGLLYFLLTGRPPHQGPTTAAVLTKALNADVPPVRALNPAAPPELEAVCRRALALRPADRHPSADALADEVEQYLRPAAAPAPPRDWARTAVLVGLAAGLVLVAGVVVKFRKSGQKETTLEVPPGSTVQVEPDGNVTVALPKDPAPPAPDPDRRAAELLHPYCTLTVRLPDLKLRAVAPGDPLPAGPFTVTRIGFPDARPLPEEFADQVFLPAVTGLRGLANITDTPANLWLSERQVVELLRSPGAASLTTLSVNFCLTRRVLDELTRLPRLTELRCNGQEADDDALVRLKELPELACLSLTHLGESPAVTRRGLLGLAALQVKTLILWEPRGVDWEVARAIGGMSNLRELWIIQGDLTDDGLAEIVKARKLAMLFVQGNSVTDAGLACLKDKKALTDLNVAGTRATEAGVCELAAALPGCNLCWK